MSTLQERQAANQARRERAAAKQAPLPMAEQLRRAEARRESHRAQYPSEPVLDPLSQVRGDPRGLEQPVRRRVVPRDLTFADILYVFGLDLLGRRKASR